MARKADTTPPMRLHKASGQAYVNLGGKRIYLGKHDAPNIKRVYQRTVAEWINNGGRPNVTSDEMTVMELVERYTAYATDYYKPREGTTRSETQRISVSVRPLVSMYGDIDVVDFGPLALDTIRNHWIDAGLCRTTINTQINTIRRMFKWGVGRQLVPPTVLTALNALEPLKQGRSKAREPRRIFAVPMEHVDAIQGHVSRQVWGLIQLQLLTGARSSEVLRLRRIDFDTSGAIWTAKPEHHKSSHKGKDRTLYFGAKAQAVLREFFPGKGPTEYLFSPADAERERLAKKHAARVTPMSCGNKPGSNRTESPTRSPGAFYTPDTYRKAVGRGCKAAGVPDWHPHQLRHTAATRIRKELGLEAAQVWLGHSNADVTQIYAEVDHARALEIAKHFG